MADPAGEPKLTLYTAGTPNGWKASVTLEELGLHYAVRKIDMGKKEQKEDWFLKINPNGRIPAIVDHENGDYAVFESGALMMYLCDQHGDGTLLPPTSDIQPRYEVMSWLMFQMAGLGPMQGQANYFLRYAPEQIKLGQERYMNETKRLYSVLDTRLQGRDWLAAGRYTIADIANYCWVAVHFWAGIETLDEYPNLKAWVERIEQRPAVARGVAVPEGHASTPAQLKAMMNDPQKVEKIVGMARKITVPVSSDAQGE